jgi:hypothetical protein
MNTTVKANPKGFPLPNNPERELLQEEQLVAELELLGVRYLSRLTGYRAQRVRPPQRLLADLIRQSNSRVRIAFISLLLSYPAYARFIPEVLRYLSLAEQWTLKYYYTAAVFLQKKFAHRLEPFLTDRWSWLPDWFSAELGIPGQLSFDEQLRTLGRQHRQQTGILLNWAGTYENAAKHLIRRWELEQKWNQ